ncbi:MAG: hypothetical protein WCF85_16815 [Rhodospirillaceae bacterium]
MNPDLRHLDPIQQAMLIHTAECELAEVSAWSRAAKRASDRIKMQANITRQKKLVWQAKHGR